MWFIAALDASMSSWCDLLLLLCTNHAIHRDWDSGESMEHGCLPWYHAAAAVLLLYCCMHIIPYWSCGCESQRLLLKKKTLTALLDRFVCL